MTMGIQDIQSEHYRRSILNALSAMTNFKTNDSMLQCTCEKYGHVMSRDVLLTHIAWLKEQGLVTTEEHGGYVMAQLTGRGQDVAEGRSNVPGIKAPRAR